MSTTARSLGRPISAPAWALLLILGLLIAIAAAGLTVGQWWPFTDSHRERPDRLRPVRCQPRRHRAPHRPAGRVRHARGAARRERVPAVLAGWPSTVDRLRNGQRRWYGQAPSSRTRCPTGDLGCSTWSPDGTRLAVEGFNDADPSFAGIFLADSSDGTRCHPADHERCRSATTSRVTSRRTVGSSPTSTTITDNGATLWVVDVATGDGTTGRPDRGRFRPDVVARRPVDPGRRR